jgi:hypothetical protein
MEQQDDFSRCPHFYTHELTEEQIIAIAKKVAILVEEERDKKIGRLTQKGFYYLIGALGLGLYSLAIANGYIKLK